MDTRAEIIADIVTDPEAAVRFDSSVAVSLDCPVCRRTSRTIVLKSDPPEAYCTPTRHDFPGRLDAITVDANGPAHRIVYAIAYDTADFVDMRHNDTSTRNPTWARVSFDVTCACGVVTRSSVQNNSVRPYVNRCACGRVVSDERTEQPQFRAFDSAGTLLYSAATSQMVLRLDSTEGLSDATKALLAEVIGQPWPELAATAAAHRPILARDTYGTPGLAPLMPGLDHVARALLHDGAPFDLALCGRSLVDRYRRQFNGPDPGQSHPNP
jgi:hypothetical protein